MWTSDRGMHQALGWSTARGIKEQPVNIMWTSGVGMQSGDKRGTHTHLLSLTHTSSYTLRQGEREREVG